MPGQASPLMRAFCFGALPVRVMRLVTVPVQLQACYLAGFFYLYLSPDYSGRFYLYFVTINSGATV